jgi:hypothetical protein
MPANIRVQTWFLILHKQFVLDLAGDLNQGATVAGDSPSENPSRVCELWKKILPDDLLQ